MLAHRVHHYCLLLFLLFRSLFNFGPHRLPLRPTHLGLGPALGSRLQAGPLLAFMLLCWISIPQGALFPSYKQPQSEE